MKILVTGATGFIGSHIVDRLIDCGYDVTCLVRKESNLKWIRDKIDFIKVVRGDFLYPETLKDAINDIDTVIHVAGLPYANDWHKYYIVNFIGTKNILQACLNSKKVKRLIYFSSQSASGSVSKGILRTEDMPPKPISHSGRSKLLAEEELLKSKDAIHITIIRPTLIYGPRDMNLLNYFRMVKKGIFISFGNIERILNVCYIDDLIDAVEKILNANLPSGEVFFIGSDNYPLYEVKDIFSKVVGKQVRNITVPGKLLPLLFFMAEIIGRFLKKNLPLNCDLAKEMQKESWAVSCKKAEILLGYKPKINLKVGLQITYDWYKKFYYL